ncbi:MAG: ABC transporter ATP-binding protein [Dehalobacterium sp.]|jgi:peptide/nickel transport system ATP-binding protein
MRLKAEKISFKYNEERYILKDVDFSVESGEIVGLMAPSGFGKTTLAKILAGYEKPHSGQIILEGCPYSKKGYNPVQLIFQHPEQAVNPLWKMSKIVSEAGPPSRKLMDAMGIKESWLNRWPTELSGGELQRFCVLRVLTEKTKFIIADEMTTMLDPITQAQIWEVVINFAQEHHIGIVVISHELSLVRKICHRIVDLEKI